MHRLAGSRKFSHWPGRSGRTLLVRRAFICRGGVGVGLVCGLFVSWRTILWRRQLIGAMPSLLSPPSEDEEEGEGGDSDDCESDADADACCGSSAEAVGRIGGLW